MTYIGYFLNHGVSREDFQPRLRGGHKYNSKFVKASSRAQNCPGLSINPFRVIAIHLLFILSTFSSVTFAFSRGTLDVTQ
jgi:hypothetical protein